MRKLKALVALVALILAVGFMVRQGYTQTRNVGVQNPNVGSNAIFWQLSWDGALGSYTSSSRTFMSAPCTGHFNQLTCVATLTGSCTTGPTINAFDVTASTSGTGVSPGTTVASPAPTSESLAFNVGDSIALGAAATPSACASPVYSCHATLSCP